MSELTREQIEGWRKDFMRGYKENANRDELNALFDLALRSLSAVELAGESEAFYCEIHAEEPRRFPCGYQCDKCKETAAAGSGGQHDPIGRTVYEQLKTEHCQSAATPVAWIRGHSYHTDLGREYDEEVVAGRDKPSGDGWAPLYTHPATPFSRAALAERVVRDLAARCRPAVKQWANQAAMSSLNVERGKYPPHYKPLLEAEAKRAADLLDELDEILDLSALAAGEVGK